jgi:hypothetical protein
MEKEHRFASADVVRAIVEHDSRSTVPALGSDADGDSEDDLEDLVDLCGMRGTFCLPSVCIFSIPFQTQARRRAKKRLCQAANIARGLPRNQVSSALPNPSTSPQ